MRKLIVACTLVSVTMLIFLFETCHAGEDDPRVKLLQGKDIRRKIQNDTMANVKLSLLAKTAQEMTERDVGTARYHRWETKEIDPCRASTSGVVVTPNDLYVIVEVSQTMNLADTTMAKVLLEKGKEYAISLCKKPFSDDIVVAIYQSPITLENVRNEWIVRMEYGSKDDYVFTENRLQYENKALIKKRTEERQIANKKEEERREQELATQEVARLAQESARETRRSAEYKAQQEQEEVERRKIATRRDGFIKQHGVQEWPNADALRANPFVYQGKTIAIVVHFGEMSSATDGLFEMGTSGSMNILIVSDIPNGIFTSSRWVVLAGTVVGKKEVQLPLLGKVAIPHIKYVGVQNCPDQQCNGMGKK